MELTKQESELIQFIRTLDFDDMLNVLDGIRAVAEDLSTKSVVHASKGNDRTAQGFKSQAENMDKLEQLLGEANEEYRKEINSGLEEGE
ncbi:hypothetical protein [Paenibacillus polymyxa]|uniref:hypothetical protein n=1 Tax=Paenibacillus polymyxa TaxID=1406 RepID=UPI0025B6EF13|nr:hypothetical protein [Paenibacillus polymyxa]MDN4085921.1 hypothetical protein [Paenibacillus polymyxa]MDN4111823.1 hypothetical protein [Paenibacillus polymyxa]